MKTAIFSGRFDPPHFGHVLTIQRLLTHYNFNRVVVIVLDYPERQACTAQEALKLFERIFERDGGPGTISLLINKEHFARITKNEYFEILRRANCNFDDAVYVAAENMEVINHFKNDLKFPYLNIKRSPNYSGTEERRLMRDEKITLKERLEKRDT